MTKLYQIVGAAFPRMFGTLQVAQKNLRAYAKYLESKDFVVYDVSDTSFRYKVDTINIDDIVFIKEYVPAMEVLDFLKEFVTD